MESNVNNLYKNHTRYSCLFVNFSEIIQLHCAVAANITVVCMRNSVPLIDQLKTHHIPNTYSIPQQKAMSRVRK